MYLWSSVCTRRISGASESTVLIGAIVEVFVGAGESPTDEGDGWVDAEEVDPSEEDAAAILCDGCVCLWIGASVNRNIFPVDTKCLDFNVARNCEETVAEKNNV